MSLINQLSQINCVQLPFDEIIIEKLNNALKNKVYVSKIDNSGNSESIVSAYNKLEFGKMKTLDKFAYNATHQGVEKNIFMVDGCCSDYVDILDGLRIEIYNKMNNIYDHRDTLNTADFKSSIVITANLNIKKFYDNGFDNPISTIIKTDNLTVPINIMSPLIEWLLYIGIPISQIIITDETNNRMGSIVL